MIKKVARKKQSESVEKSPPKISPEEYRDILKGVNLYNIYLKNLSASVDKENRTKELDVNIIHAATVTTLPNRFTVESTYELVAKNSNQQNHIKITATYVLEYSTEKEITAPFFEVYKDNSLQINIWPFFRELVNSTTARMHIEPLTLPLLKR